MLQATGAHGQIAASAGHSSHTLEYVLMGASVLVGLLGIAIAYMLYIKNTDVPGRIAGKAQGLYTLVYNKYFVDEAYERTIVRPGYSLSERIMFRIVDMGIIEGIVNGLGITARLVGAAVRLAQSGVIRTYAFFILLGFIYVLYKVIW